MSDSPSTGRPVVLRGGTVLTDGRRAHACSPAPTCSSSATGSPRSAPASPVPDGTVEIDATGGIVMPGMIDTHRHMWQTAMRGYGADWTLTQYFVWYYLEHGKLFRPQDMHAGNLLAALEALDAGVTTTRRLVARAADHRARRRRRRRAAGGARPVRARLRQHPGRARGSGRRAPEFRDFVEPPHHAGDDMLGFQMAFDVTGDPAFPEKPAFEVARELGVPVTTHAGVWGATNDDGIRLMHENGFMTPETIYVHAATLSRRLLPPHRRHRRLGVGVHRERAERRARATRPPGRCARTASRCRCRWTPACGGAATCSPRCAPRWAPTAPASTWRRTPRARPSPTATCAPSRSSSGPPAAAPRRSGRDADLGSLEVGKKADVVLIKNDALAGDRSRCCNPYGHVAFQAQRGDVHTVLVNGRVVKHDHRLVGVDLAAARRAVERDRRATCAATLGEEAWAQGHEPGHPGDQDPRQPVHVHRLPQRQHPRTLIGALR